MINSVRTTIRIRKDLLHLSKLEAVKSGTSLQEIINQTLAVGFRHVSDLNLQKRAMAKIDKFRDRMANQKINVQKLVDENKKELVERSSRLIKDVNV